MKNKIKELDVDFIGGQNNPLTQEEQLAISNFIKQLKENEAKTFKLKKEASLPYENHEQPIRYCRNNC
ncbi:MAG: hypothetical protein RJA25_764 [Bacteroidota bacterium]|jgi:hypothetical protein